MRMTDETIQISNTLPSGEYANIRCYYDKRATYEPYTVIYMDMPERRPNTFACVGLTESGAWSHSAAMPGKHLGKRIKFEDMPDAHKRLVLSDLKAGK